MNNQIEYRVVEIQDRKMTQLLAFSDARPKGVLIAFWNWRLTGKQGAYVAATRLRDSRQRMADSGKPVRVEAQMLSGPLGTGTVLKVEENVIEQFAMDLESK